MYATTPIIPSESKVKGILRDRCAADVVVNLFVKRLADSLIRHAQRGQDLLEFRVPDRMTGYPPYVRDAVCQEILQYLQAAGYKDTGMHPNKPGVIVVHFPIRSSDKNMLAFTAVK
jgi:hypothetical protein